MRRLEFHVEKEELQKAVNDVNRIVQVKSHLPLLSGIKLEAMNNVLSITGNNSEIAVNRRISGDSLTIIEQGNVVVPAKMLLEIIKKFPGKVHVKSSLHQVLIRSDDIIVHLPIFNSEDYPDLPNIHEKSLTVKSEQFYQTIKQTVFAVAKDFSRPSLTGVQFTIRGEELTCVATDSQRLAFKKVPVNSDYDVIFTVPGSSLIELLKLSPLQEVLHISFNRTHILFETNTFALYSNLIEGIFPNTSNLILETFKTTIVLDTKRFLSGIERASLFSSEWRNHNVQLEILDESHIKISSNGRESGRIEETQAITERSGEANFIITLDARFLLDALKVIEEETINICYVGEMKPILIRPVGNLNQLHLVSPVRTN